MNKWLLDRLAALEARDTPPWRVVIRHDDETAEQAKKREGVKPGECVIVVSELDEAL